MGFDEIICISSYSSANFSTAKKISNTKGVDDL